MQHVKFNKNDIVIVDFADISIGTFIAYRRIGGTKFLEILSANGTCWVKEHHVRKPSTQETILITVKGMKN